MRTHTWRKSFTRLSQRKLPLPVQRRHFHPSQSRLVADSGGSGSGNGRDGAERDKAQAENAAAIRKQADDQGVADSKLKRTSLRRSRLYSKTPRELPSFTIPNWFLKHNVRLSEAVANDRTNARTLTLVDRDTGHVVLTLPFVDLAPVDSTSTSTSDPTSTSASDATSTSAQIKSFATNFFSPRDVAVGKEMDSLVQGDQSASAPDKQLSDTQSPTPSPHDSPPTSRAAQQLSTPPVETQPDVAQLMFLHLQLLMNAVFDITGPNAAKIERPNISLLTSDVFAHDELDRFVENLADLVHADIVRLDANDLAELAAEYLDPQDFDSALITSLPYDVYKGAGAVKSLHVEIPDNFGLEDPQDPHDPEADPDAADNPFGQPSPLSFSNIDVAQLGKFFQQNAGALTKALSDSRGPLAIDLSRIPGNSPSKTNTNPSTSPSFTIGSWEELKLQTMLDTLLDGTAAKRDAQPSDTPSTFLRNSFHSPTPNRETPASPTAPADQSREADLTRLLKDYVVKRVDSPGKDHSVETVLDHQSVSADIPSVVSEPGNRTIVHIRDLEPIRQTPQGEAIIRLFAKVLQRRRKDGQQIIMVGTTASHQRRPMDDIEAEEEEESSFRSVQYHSDSSALTSNLPSFEKLERSLSKPGYQRLVDINLRNIQSMIRRLGLQPSESLFDPATRNHMNLAGTWKLGDYALSQDQVQQTVLYAESIRSTYTNSPCIETFHIALATALKQSIENSLEPLSSFHVEPMIPTARPRGSSKGSADSSNPAPPKVNIEKLKRSCDKHEKKLLGGVVDAHNIKTTFTDVHAASETKEALKTLTSLSLLRPEAFQYGVLANDRLPGLLLYGPPGTGKTMLAKAVAKESQATVLEVSGAQVYEKYVGEGEKMVKAVFSLAKKLSPCIVFIDEADALFGSRGGANNRTTHREIINQFLREWDGMDDHSVFMMVATNRPFDLDDAVLRRLPRRLLIDLPVAKDRESILGIHLKGETLDSTVSLNRLAEQTALYSGSDLKNVCVAAALTAVREENELLVKNKDNKEFKLPERRTLTDKHFEKALSEISASISEDMSTLSSIRKFDEQYGDRRAKRKKTAYGFGATTEPDENAARVRQDGPRP